MFLMEWPPVDLTLLSRDVTGALAVLSFIVQIPFVRDAGQVLVGMLQDYREHLDERRDERHEEATRDEPEKEE